MNPTNILLTFGILSGIGVLYFDTFVRVGKNLFTYESSHGLLILTVSLYLVWKKRDLLRRLPVRPNLIFGTVLMAFGCFLFLSGKLSSTQLLQQVSLVATLLGVIYLTLGYGHFRALVAPVGYIIFMFGFFEEIFSSISIYLQSIAARIAFNFLKPTGWPVFLKGQIIELPHISLEVARACNGINHIIALVALAVPLAIMTQRTLTKKMSLILIAFLIGIFANGLRVALIGIWSYFNKSGPLHGPFDTLYVSFIFFFGMGLLLLISRLLGKPFRKSQTANGKGLTRNLKQFLLTAARQHGSTAALGNSSNSTNPTNPSNLINPTNPSNPSNPKIDRKHQNSMRYALCAMRASAKLPFASLVGIFILLSTISLVHFYKPKPVYLTKPLNEFPMTVGEWTGKDVSNLDVDIFKEFSADNELKRIYSNHSVGEIKLYIGYFPAQQQGKKVIDYRLGWLHDHPDTIRIIIDEEEISIRKATWQDRRSPKKVYFWYNMNGRKILNPYRAKIVTALDAFTKRRTNGAITLMIVDRGQGEEQSEHLQFLQSIFPLIQNHLK